MYIMSMDGRIVAQKEIIAHKIEISHLAGGAYLLQLKSENEVYTQKLQIIQ